MRSARSWLSDPANEGKRAALVGQLQGWSQRAGGTAGQTASRLAGEVSRRRRVSVGGWESEMMSLRYEIVDLAPGPVREAALEAYAAQAHAGATLVADAPAAKAARTRQRVVAALTTEAGLLRTERLSHDERRRASEAVQGAQEACYRPEARVRLSPP